MYYRLSFVMAYGGEETELYSHGNEICQSHTQIVTYGSQCYLCQHTKAVVFAITGTRMISGFFISHSFSYSQNLLLSLSVSVTSSFGERTIWPIYHLLHCLSYEWNFGRRKPIEYTGRQPSITKRHWMQNLIEQGDFFTQVMVHLHWIHFVWRVCIKRETFGHRTPLGKNITEDIKF